MGRERHRGQEKKLEDAARHWASGGAPSNDEAIADLKAFGAPADVIAELEAQQPEHFEVWPENWPAVEMFLRLQTQWRHGFGGALGLDYVAARWLFDLYPPEDPRDLLEALQVMERAALAAFSEGGD